MNPFDLFQEFYQKEIEKTTVQIPSACCFSTNGIDSFPNARIVSLKEIKNNQFVITGSINSRKGIEVALNNKVALTFWWTKTEVQVRVQGIAKPISNQEADVYFSERNQESKIVSNFSEQGKPINDFSKFQFDFEIEKSKLKNSNIKRPETFGGFSISPIRVEFLEFKSNRLHTRQLFVLENGNWEHSFLQP